MHVCSRTLYSAALYNVVCYREEGTSCQARHVRCRLQGHVVLFGECYALFHGNESLVIGALYVWPTGAVWSRMWYALCHGVKICLMLG